MGTLASKKKKQSKMRSALLALAFLVLLSSTATLSHASPIPVVVWHGMGDHAHSEGMTWVQDMMKKAIPGLYTYSIQIGKTADEDILHGFIGNMWDQIDDAFHQIMSDPVLSVSDSISILTFSQGGQLARGLVEVYGHRLPAIHSMVTFGGQHQGVSDVPNCVDADESFCHLVADLIDKGAYLPGIRENVIQAQYLMDMGEWSDFLEYSFISYINNMGPAKNQTFKDNLMAVGTFVAILWEQDTVVVPRISEHFGRYVDASLNATLSMQETPLYKEDWIGIKSMYESSPPSLIFLQTPGQHMTINQTYFVNDIVMNYFAH